MRTFRNDNACAPKGHVILTVMSSRAAKARLEQLAPLAAKSHHRSVAAFTDVIRLSRQQRHAGVVHSLMRSRHGPSYRTSSDDPSLKTSRFTTPES